MNHKSESKAWRGFRNRIAEARFLNALTNGKTTSEIRANRVLFYFRAQPTMPTARNWLKFLTAARVE
jgi:hypothetical protein